MKKKKVFIMLMCIMFLFACGKKEESSDTNPQANTMKDTLGPQDEISDSFDEDNKVSNDMNSDIAENDVLDKMVNILETENDLLLLMDEQVNSVLFQYSGDEGFCKVLYMLDSNELYKYREVIHGFEEIHYSSTDETMFRRESDVGNCEWFIYYNDKLMLESLIIEAEEEERVSWYKDSYTNYEASEIKVLYNYLNSEKNDGGFCIITIPFSKEEKQTEQYINTFCAKKTEDGSEIYYYPGYSWFIKSVLTENTIYFTDDYNKNVLCELDIETGKITHWEDMLEELAIYAEPYDGIICDIQPFAYKEGYLLVRILFGEKEVSKAKFAVYTGGGELVSIFSE